MLNLEGDIETDFKAGKLVEQLSEVVETRISHQLPIGQTGHQRLIAGRVVTLVVLPGMDGTGDLFADFAAALGDGMTIAVIAYPCEQMLDYQGLEDHVRARLPVDEPYVLLAESFSGPIAISIAASRPAGLAGLVLCCTFARNPRPLFRSLQGLTAYLPISVGFLPLIASWLTGRYSRAGLTGRIGQTLSRIPAGILRHRLREVVRVDYSERMRRVRTAMLYLQAADDRIVPSSAARHLLSLAPDMQLATLAGPHLLLQTKPLDAANIVRDFLRGIGQA